MNTSCTLSVVLIAMLFATVPAAAQVGVPINCVAEGRPGTLYGVPAWNQVLPATERFDVLIEFNCRAVLDRETGLVWWRNPIRLLQVPSTYNLMLVEEAVLACATFTGETSTAGQRIPAVRLGWRLPTVAELMSLFEAVPDETAPRTLALPEGHPFNLPTNSRIIAHAIPLPGGLQLPSLSQSGPGQWRLYPRPVEFGPQRPFAWCVRGAPGAGHSGL